MTDTPQTIAAADPKDARVLQQHLDPGYGFSADFESQTPAAEDGPGSSSNSVGAAPESSLQLQGGDIHRDLYKIAAQGRRAKLHQRAATFSHAHEYNAPSEPDLDHDDLPIQEQLRPQGMRRAFLQQQSKRASFIGEMPVTRNFMQFLELYGNFAGEDLEESDDDDDAVEEEEQEGERRPLLGRRQSSKRLRERGDADQVKTFFTLLKAFIGTGIMFLPKAFKNGGMLFSSITMITVSAITALCFELLLSCRKQYGGAGYGDLGRSISGPKLRALILVSITLSQIGFVCAGLIFTADNLASFIDAVSKEHALSTNVLIGLQCVILIPLSFIRNISKLGPAALLADVFILFGLTYIYWFDISWISKNGGFHESIELFNPRDFTMTIGSAIFTFEGIGLILPIQSSMKQPEHFSKLLYIVMLMITVIFTSVGVLCYGTFGDHVSVEVITNFPQSSKLVNAVQFLYAMAVLVGTPVQLFPAMRTIELKIFKRASGKQSNLTKWKKNAFRTTLVLFCGLVAAVGASDLDKFVALIGSFACVPLVYIYPAYLHYKGVADRPWAKGGDITMMVLGFVAMAYTTTVTVARWADE
jgi:proton-coupled amino acid transporter